MCGRWRRGPGAECGVRSERDWAVGLGHGAGPWGWVVGLGREAWPCGWAVRLGLGRGAGPWLGLGQWLGRTVATAAEINSKSINQWATEILKQATTSEPAA